MWGHNSLTEDFKAHIYEPNASAHLNEKKGYYEILTYLLQFPDKTKQIKSS